MNVTPFRQNVAQSGKTQSSANKNYFMGFELCEKTRGGKSGGLRPDIAQPKTTTPVIL